MAKVIGREVMGSLIILHTVEGYCVCTLRDWNMNQANARILFQCKTKAEISAYENWIADVVKEVFENGL